MNSDLRRALLYFGRACLLKCPECGTKPVFLPLLRIRRLRDYFYTARWMFPLRLRLRARDRLFFAFDLGDKLWLRKPPRHRDLLLSGV
jgi:hypothetical protein